jgi:hypothetical protein
MSNSAVFFVPAARSCARVVALPCLVSPPHLRCRRRRCGGGARRHLGDSGRSGPPDEGRAERRQAHSSLLFGRAREARPPRLCGAAPSRCERDPSRRSTVAIFGRGSTPPSPAVGHRSRQRIVRARPRGLADGIPDLPGLRFAPPPRDATPRSACRIVSGDAPQERGCECLSQLRYVVNSTVVSQSKFFACSGCESLAAGPPAAPFASGTAPLL